MSYAEYGSRIFFTQRIDTKLPTGEDNELPDKYSGCRLKKHDSCLDLRAWSLNQLDYCRYFREVTELEPSSEKIIRKELAVEAVESTHEKELEYLRRELAKYKSLKLTPEQKKQLGHSDLWEAFSKEGWNLFESFLNQVEKIKGYKETLLGRAFPGSFVKIEEIHDDNVELKQFDNISRPIKRKLMNEIDMEKNTTEPESPTSSIKVETDKTDTNYTSSDQSDNSSDCYIKSKSTNINEDDDDDIDNINSIRDSQTETISTDFEHDHIIKEKDAEIEKFNNLNMKLRLMLEKRDIQIDNLHEKLAKTHCQLREIVDQRNAEVDELKTKLSDGKNLIDQLKKKLEEQRLQCSIQMKNIEDFKYDTISQIEYLRNERDSLVKKLNKVLKNVNGVEVHESIETWIYERKALKDENRNLERQCSELEEKINCLLKLNDENNNQRFKMEQIIENLRIEIGEKNQQVDNYDHQLSTLMRESEEAFVTHEKSFRRDETIDANLDETLGAYLKQKVDNIKDFSSRLEDAWNYVERRKIEYDNLRKQVAENERIFQDKFNEKCQEVKQYCEKYEECKELIENQKEEIDQLRKEEYSCEMDEELNYLRETIAEMKSKLNSLQEENSELIDENENLHCQIHEMTEEITLVQNENEKLSHEIRSMNVQLDDKNAKIDVLKDENLQLARTLEDTNDKLKTMFIKSNSMKLEVEKIDSLSQLQKEIVKDDKEKRKLKETIAQLRHEHDSYQKKNKRLEDNLVNTSNQKISLETKISAIKGDIARLLNDYEDNMHLNNIYSDVNLMHLPEKLVENIKALQQRLSLSNTSIHSANELIDHNRDQFRNHDNEETHTKSHAGEMNGIDQNTDNNYDKLKSKELIIISLKEENHKLSLKLNAERVMYENKLEKLQQNKTVYEDHNNILKRLENENATINDPFKSSLKTNGINIDNKDNNINNSDNYDQNSRTSASTYFEHINPTLEKNLDDFSKINEQYNNNAINNCRIFFPHNGTNGHIKSKQRNTKEESVRPENLSCQQFIRSCSERRNHENY